MHKLFFVLLAISFLVFTSCDDGDIITVELDFDDTFEVCDGGNDLVFYKTKEDPSESLSLKVSNRNIEDILEVDDTGVFEETYTISATNPFNYRTYSNSELPTDLFCNVIPNSGINITQDIESTSGTALLRTVLVEDDNDGIPAELEDINNNGNLEDDDSDGDGLPNYIDPDDDGDNVLTRDEDPDPNGDENLSDALDTDGDTIPDYLDEDDDGDGVKTRDEENDTPQDENPGNDSSTSDPLTGQDIPDYLNADINTTVPAKAYREVTISQTFTVSLLISEIDLEIIALDVFNFGTLSNGVTTSSRKFTPEFP